MNEEFWKILDDILDRSEIVIDRPIGTPHPRYSDITYKVDYGYLKNTKSMDGSGIDVWLGSGEKKIVAIICTVDSLKFDSEIKILIGCNEQEIDYIYDFHNKSQYMKGVLIRRIGINE